MPATYCAALIRFSQCILLGLASLFANPLCAQKPQYDYTWIFGNESFPEFSNGCTIDFKESPPKIDLTATAVYLYVATSMISDRSGYLAAYTNGCAIWNAEHKMIAGSDSINYDPIIWEGPCLQNLGYPTGFQSTLFLPLPGQDSVYYLFSKPIKYMPGPYVFHCDRMLYHVVDMRQNGGAGKVYQRNSLLYSNPADTSYGAGDLTAVRHANNEDWWVCTVGIKGNCYAFRFSKDGIVDTVISQVSVPCTEFVSGSTFSPDGTKFARYRAKADGLILMDFDRETGVFSNASQQFADLHPPDNIGSATFSPSGRFLYLSSVTRVYQYDMQTGELDTVAIWNGIKDGDVPVTFYGSQLGPDCRIYIFPPNGVKYLHVIERPEVKGAGCHVCQGCIELQQNTGISGAHFPNFDLGSADPYPCDSTLSGIHEPGGGSSSPFSLVPNPALDQIQLRSISTRPVVVEIYDLLGRLCLREALVSGTQSWTIDISQLQSGMYSVCIQDSTKARICQQLIVQH